MLLELVLLLLTIISLMVILLVPLADINLRPKTIRKMSKLPGPRLLPLFIGFAYKLVTLAETGDFNLVYLFYYLFINFHVKLNHGLLQHGIETRRLFLFLSSLSDNVQCLVGNDRTLPKIDFRCYYS